MIYRFSGFCLDTTDFLLAKGGETVAVEPQVFNLLQFLIENRERVVTKDQLINAVWDGRIVSDAALNSRINAARRAVGDDGKTQSIIKTFARRGFRFVAEVDDSIAAQGQTGQQSLSQRDKPTIAILPFSNMSGDQEQDYFADGITEDIITNLSRIRQFFVTARNTTFVYKGQAVDVQAVASELNVRYVLEGSVRKSGDRVRITAQLIDGDTGKHIWADRYDRDLEDIFAVQDELTQTVVGALQPELTRSEIERARRKRTDSLDAWDLHQRGLWHLFRITKEDNARAIELFKRAIELDPEFVNPYAELAETCVMDGLLGYTQTDIDEIYKTARKAVEIDPDYANAHHALGRAHFASREYASSIDEFNIAIQLNPSEARYYIFLAFAQMCSGFAEDALANVNRGLKLSPRDPVLGIFYTAMAVAFLCLGRNEECLAYARMGRQHPPFPWTVRAYAVAALGHLQREEEFEAALADLFACNSNYSIALARRLLPVTYEPYRNRIIEGLKKAGLPEG
jgi:TolB-like protein/cytochrome c-type biogenesis protein CcmH/NrfG